MAHRTLTQNQLERILTTRLKLREPKFLLERVGGLLVGHVISPTFQGKRDHKRQTLIWDALDDELGKDAVRQVGMLLAYTPQEWNLDAEDQPVTNRAKRAG